MRAAKKGNEGTFRESGGEMEKPVVGQLGLGLFEKVSDGKG